MPSTVNLLAELSVPSKTFLLGEYLILGGGPALLVATAPRFSLKVSDSPENQKSFHPESPAGLLLQKYPERNLKFEFIDPHQSSGGLGASSAQFALVQAFSDPGMDLQKIYQSYRLLSVNQDRFDRPSGGDVVAQVNGGLTYFHPLQNRVEKAEWQFDDLDFSLFKTSQKLATHEHLKETRDRLVQFQKSDLLKPAQTAVDQALSSLKNRDAAAFVGAFRSFAAVLNELRFVSDLTKDLLTELKSRPEVLAAKGCGAMGADVICVLHKPQDKIELPGLRFLASSLQIEAQGLRFDSAMK